MKLSPDLGRRQCSRGRFWPGQSPAQKDQQTCSQCCRSIKSSLAAQLVLQKPADSTALCKFSHISSLSFGWLGANPCEQLHEKTLVDSLNFLEMHRISQCTFLLKQAFPLHLPEFFQYASSAMPATQIDTTAKHVCPRPGNKCYTGHLAKSIFCPKP